MNCGCIYVDQFHLDRALLLVLGIALGSRAASLIDPRAEIPAISDLSSFLMRHPTDSLPV